ncbi:MAG: EscU/YscU/HrcU family type III secretion system export apparatus switch protein [Acidiphilium sp.]|nr:EscU/YscU/HrcU family type III secretion system export apparatus switch protein [Acidiphilium sp.]MDD4936092.1 EscU/YscU/HrcU family type III secretion system export apparatus switch protein [Acidiphilium sp.]
MAENDSQTEAATPIRLTKAQSDGDGVISREVATFATLAAAVLVFVGIIPALIGKLTESLTELLAHAGQVNSSAEMIALISPDIDVIAEIIIATGLCISGASIAATLLQTGFRLNKKAIGLHFDRLNPISGLSDILSLRHTVISSQSILKIICIGSAVYFIINKHIDMLFNQIALPVNSIPATIVNALVTILVAGALTQGLIAAVDFLWSKRQFATRTQMSQGEIKDEQKEIDGDPAIKAKLKILRALQAKRNLKAAMARAAVVVTNPTHYAVALEYHAGQTQAPRVVAKGADHMAAKIREMARELRIPIVPNPPLARALFTLDEDTEIAQEHYRAVAEVIAYIWKLAERRPDLHV